MTIILTHCFLHVSQYRHRDGTEDGVSRRRGSSIRQFPAPGAEDRHRTTIRKVLGRLGLDFVVAGSSFISRQLGKLTGETRGWLFADIGLETLLECPP